MYWGLWREEEEKKKVEDWQQILVQVPIFKKKKKSFLYLMKLSALIESKIRVGNIEDLWKIFIILKIHYQGNWAENIVTVLPDSA